MVVVFYYLKIKLILGEFFFFWKISFFMILFSKLLATLIGMVDGCHNFTGFRFVLLFNTFFLHLLRICNQNNLDFNLQQVTATTTAVAN